MTFYLLIFSYNYCILSQCTSIIPFFTARKCAIIHFRGQNHQQHIFLVRAEHACEAIISSRASAHRLHEVLLFDRKFILISYQIKEPLQKQRLLL